MTRGTLACRWGDGGAGLVEGRNTIRRGVARPERRERGGAAIQERFLPMRRVRRWRRARWLGWLQRLRQLIRSGTAKGETMASEDEDTGRRAMARFESTCAYAYLARRRVGGRRRRVLPGIQLMGIW